MDEKIHITWYPGHMVKAQKLIREHLRLVDVAVELLDARIPRSSANPALGEIVGDKPRIVVLNKADLADGQATARWIEHFAAAGVAAIAVDAMTGKGTKQLVAKLEELARPQTERLAAKGVKPRAARAMILGIPNVGKSSLINRLAGQTIAKAADKPGVTRAKQWIKVGKRLELLDTPGVLWPKFEDQQVGLHLAFTGAINDEVYDMEKVIYAFLDVLRLYYPQELAARYKLPEALPPDSVALLDEIGRRRGCLRSGGLIDREKVRRMLLNEFRAGKLGRITLDRPE